MSCAAAVVAAAAQVVAALPSSDRIRQLAQDVLRQAQEKRL